MGAVLRSTFVAALLGAALSATGFIASALLDGAQAVEAVAYGMALGVGGALAGALIGLIIGLLRLGPVGGALVGLGLAVTAIAFYVFGIGRPGQEAYFLGASVPVILFFGLPIVVTGGLTAWLNGRRAAERAT
jgi:hypothetical protein